jgi:hypothetical protein
MDTKMKPGKSGKNSNLTIYIRAGEPVDEKPKEFLALLFDKKKNFLEGTVVKNDQAVFKTQGCEMGDFQLLLAPNRKEIKAEKNYDQLIARHKAYQPIIKQGPRGEFEILPIPELYLNLWWIRKCRVKGNVSKYFDISGFYQKKGLCNMRVHICEVDRWIWLVPRIPDHVLLRIPELVLKPKLPFPVPVDPIREVPEIPDPIGPITTNIDGIFEATSFQTTNESILDNPENLQKMEVAQRSIAGDRNISQALQSGNPTIIRELLLQNYQLFHPIFCITPWLWPWFYKCDEIKVVYTDANGDFDTQIIYNLFGDKPDLYFWVEAHIDGSWQTVYKPPLPCNVYWNYQCGRHVPITVTDPRVDWECTEDLDGQVIWVKTIGTGTSVSHIEQHNVNGAPIQGKVLNRQGLTDKFEGSGNYRRPFGSGLSFRVQFSSGLPTNKYTYYRWSYRKVKNGDLSNAGGSVEQIGNLVEKLYSYEFIGSDGFLHIGYNKMKLGPVDKGPNTGLYLIPTPSPQDAPFNATENQADWQSKDTWTISFDSNLQGDGLYEFTLELFDKNGNKINDIPNELFQVPHFNTFAPSVVAPSVNRIASGANTCSAFKMLMRLDNSVCTAAISKIKVDGVEKNPTCCGFVPYEPGSNLEVTFRAYHPNNFADLSFVVKKGTCNDSVQSSKTNASGMVIGDANTTDGVGYSRNSFSEYSRTFTPSELLGICTSEGKAAFAEHLYVNALAINGNNEINTYDRSALAAFALEPA